MELTRRDALAALASAGIAVGGGAAALARERTTAEPTTEEASLVQPLIDVAGFVYPSPVTNVETFVRTYSERKVAERTAYREGLADAVANLDRYAAGREDARSFVALDAERQEALLEGIGVDATDPDPHGTPADRIRYYVVNELLYALYTSPTGGKLVGLENPQGHPGGTRSYRQGPQARDRTEGGSDD